jgi:hypothetical protein
MRDLAGAPIGTAGPQRTINTITGRDEMAPAVFAS